MFVYTVSNRCAVVNLAIYQSASPTGVSDVGEFVEICGGTQEILMFLHGSSIGSSSAKTQGCQDEYEEVGVSHSSCEASNDRGAKGWQIDLT